MICHHLSNNEAHQIERAVFEITYLRVKNEEVIVFGIVPRILIYPV